MREASTQQDPEEAGLRRKVLLKPAQQKRNRLVSAQAARKGRKMRILYLDAGEVRRAQT